MEAHEELRGFNGDRPIVVSLVTCDSVAVGVGTNKLTLIGLFDSVFMMQSPVVLPGAIVATLSGVVEPIDLRFEIVAYPNDQPLGVRQLIGRSHIDPPAVGTVATTFVSGALVFPATEPGRCDIRLYGNGELMLSRPIYLNRPPGATPEGQPQV